MTPRIRPAKIADVPDMLALARRYTDCVGFLPRPAVEEYVARETAWVALTPDGAPAGYIIARPAPAYDRRCVTIVQAAVPADLHRHAIATALVDVACRAASESAGCTIGQAFVARDIPATAFWHALGFRVIGERPGGERRRRTQLIYRRPLAPAALIEVIDPRSLTRPGTTRPVAPREQQLTLWTPGDTSALGHL